MLKRFLLLSLLALSISFSQWDQFCSQSLLNCSIFPLTALITVILLAFIHMLGSVIQSPQLEGWVKVEIRELITGFILALMLVGLALGSSGFSFVLTGEADLQKNANTKLTTLLNNLKPAYESLIRTSHYMGVLSGYSYVYPVPLWYASYTYMNAPYSGVSSILTLTSQGTQAVTNAIFLYVGLKVLLNFFLSSEFSITFASVALALRVFPFTRQLGNTLIALWIGATIIFPFSIVLMSMFHDVALSSSGSVKAPSITTFDAMKIKIPAGLGAICSNDWLRGFTAVSEVGWGLIICLPLAITGIGFQACWDTVTEVVYPVTVMGFQVFWGSAFISQATQSGINMELVFNIVSDFLEKLNYVVVLSYIDTFTVAIITVIGTKSVSTALGGEYYLFGLQRLV